MDLSALSPYLGPLGFAALLALYGLASLAIPRRYAMDAGRMGARPLRRLGYRRAHWRAGQGGVKRNGAEGSK